MKFRGIAIEDRRAVKKAIRSNFSIVCEKYAENRTGTPADTIAEIVDAIGYDSAVVTIAEIVNTVGTWDGRVSADSRAWAESIENAADADSLRDAGIYQPNAIHPAHINQLAEAMAEYTPAEVEEAPVKVEEAPVKVEDLRNKVDSIKARSAWMKGVKLYASDLLDGLEEAIDGGYFSAEDIKAPKLLEKQLLNGASDWDQYSWGGCSLCYNGQIAKRLCTASELKKTQNGAKDPNHREQWLDTQARALYQAARLILEEANKL